MNDKRGCLFLVSSTTAARFEGFYTLAASERGCLFNVLKEKENVVSVLSSSLSKMTRMPLFVQKKEVFPSDDFSSSFSGKTSGNHPRERTTRPFSHQMCARRILERKITKEYVMSSSPFIVVVRFFLL